MHEEIRAVIHLSACSLPAPHRLKRFCTRGAARRLLGLDLKQVYSKIFCERRYFLT